MTKVLDMKKILNLVLIALLLFPSLSFAFTVENLTYSVSGAGATVTGLSDSSYEGDILIPKTVEYEGVTLLVLAVAESAFYGSPNLTGVTIPSTVTKIGDKAFMNCENLKTVILEDGEDNLETGYSYVLYGDYWTAFKDSPIETLYLGRQLSYYDVFSPFRDNPALSAVTISDNVTSIGIRLFNGCTGLTEVTIPESVTSIGSQAFYQCTGLTKVAIPNSVTSIGSYAFYQCTGLTDVTIPNSVTSIGSVTFRECTGLTSVIIPNSVTEIGFNAFYGDTALESIVSLNPEPPTCSSSGNGVFYKVDKSSCTLYVPIGSKEKYSAAYAWEDFLNIVEIDTSPVADITTDCSAEATGYYTTDGRKILQPQRGINIIRYSDGTAKKVQVK